MPKGVHENRARASRQHRWKPGGSVASNGYVKIRVGKGHPLADPNGYAYEHHVVWCSAGNPRPGPDEILHHENGDKTDNRLMNLRLMKRGEHNAHHIAEAQRRCEKTGRLGPDLRKLGIRRRLADYVAHVDAHGTINRNDVMRIGEVSRPQASADLKMLIADYPLLGLTYDKSAKTYRAGRLLDGVEHNGMPKAFGGSHV